MEVQAFAPGRVNLIGEHTDYNGGLALPFAIEQGVTVRARPARRGAWTVHALDLDETDSFAVATPGVRGWRAFARGVVTTLRGAGYELAPAEVWISGTVPLGSGLSSSAALGISLSLALLALAGVNESEIDKLKLARWCCRVENEWVGANAGLLDPVAVLFGQRDQAVRIDFQTLDVATVDCDFEDWRLVTADSGQRHSNATSGYNQRRAECEAACRALGVTSLRGADRTKVAALGPPLRERALHVLNENQRVLMMVDALAQKDRHAVGELLTDSHTSLRDLYQCSTDAIEATVKRLLDVGATGARLIGGGFGGHVLALFPPGVPLPDGVNPVQPQAGARLVAQAAPPTRRPGHHR